MIRKGRNAWTVGLIMVLLGAWGVAPMYAAEVVQLTFMHAFNHIGPDVQQEIVDEFNRRNPNIHVTIEPIPSQTARESLITRAAGGVAPDIISMDVYDSGALASARPSMLLDLTKWVETDLEDPNDMPPAAYDATRVDDAIYALPQRISSYIQLYNRAMFEEAGLPMAPHDWYDASWNWNAVGEAARRLTRDTSGDGITDIYGWESSFPTRLPPFVFQAGGNYFDAEYENFILDQKEGLQAIEFFRGLFEQESIGRQSGAFLSGTAAMWTVMGTQAELAEQNGLEWDIAPLPQGPAGPAGKFTIIAVGIPAATRHPAEAWEFLKYYMSREVKSREIKGGIFPQPRRSVTADLENYAPYFTREHINVFLQALEVGRPYQTLHPHAREIWSVMNQALNSVFRLEVAPEIALAEIKPTVEQLLAQR